MRAAVLTRHGDLDALELREMPVPRPGTDQVLIRVRAAGVNNTDINTRLAWYSKSSADGEDATWSGKPLLFPRIQGADVCGEIAGVGNGVDPACIGDRVLIEPCLRFWCGEPLQRAWYFGSECDGGFAQYVLVDARYAVKIVSPLSDAELASFPCSYSTAENLLQRANLQAGERVLVTGASGGVGSAAVQLAKARGAYVIAITSAAKQAALSNLGADKVVLRGNDLVGELGQNAVDVVIDLVAGPQFPEVIEVLKPHGRYAVSGAIAGAEVAFDIRSLYLKDLTFFASTVLDDGVFRNLIGLIENGAVVPLVAATYPLSAIAEAQRAFVAKDHVGKIVIEVD